MSLAGGRWTGSGEDGGAPELAGSGRLRGGEGAGQIVQGLGQGQ